MADGCRRARRGRPEIPLSSGPADSDLAERLRMSSTRPRTTSLKTTDQGKQLEGDQSRPDAQRQEQAGFFGRPAHQGQSPAVEYYDTVFAIAESPMQKGSALGGNRRRVDSRYARWREELGERHAQGYAGVEHGQHDRGFAARRRHGLCGRSTATSWTTSSRISSRRHDFGKTWTRITNGIPDGAYVHRCAKIPS